MSNATQSYMARPSRASKAAADARRPPPGPVGDAARARAAAQQAGVVVGAVRIGVAGAAAAGVADRMAVAGGRAADIELQRGATAGLLAVVGGDDEGEKRWALPAPPRPVRTYEGIVRCVLSLVEFVEEAKRHGSRPAKRKSSSFKKRTWSGRGVVGGPLYKGIQDASNGGGV
ncbi:hypothetical protein CCM_09594 [Cordyceps militaris CM01]|uniref:Uncharacterized protein n=1 Tax=Cordyceps militaris (strain CM01) TaxID=983644 RepID=G3JUV3_CORMM|nr:uncharacterized protein CCM_09594 [Cordyceps militaris CM01]EGX87633.1 hypothetical protein CCM_09594 [Cordyceps militaris CM01]